MPEHTIAAHPLAGMSAPGLCGQCRQSRPQPLQLPLGLWGREGVAEGRVGTQEEDGIESPCSFLTIFLNCGPSFQLQLWLPNEALQLAIPDVSSRVRSTYLH